jgi:hypothetical protein
MHRTMFLIGQYDSPFVRRVAIALRLPFEHRPWSAFGEGVITRHRVSPLASPMTGSGG